MRSGCSRSQGNKTKLNLAIQEIREQGANIILGPLSHEEFEHVKIQAKKKEAIK